MPLRYKVQMASCIALQTHRLDKAALSEFRRIHQECGSDFDIVLLYDNSRNDFEPRLVDAPFDVRLFSISDLDTRYTLNRFKSPVGITPGNTLFPLIDFAVNSDHDHFWFVEFDVRYGGNWNSFFRYFDEVSDADLLGTTLTRFPDRNRLAWWKNWAWWKSLVLPDGVTLPKRDWVRGFFPILRVSTAGIECALQANKDGWKGHHEVVWPTAMQHACLKLEDMGGSGPFVRPEHIDRFYVNDPIVSGLAPGTFVCPPEKPTPPMTDNKLYHPVKN